MTIMLPATPSISASTTAATEGPAIDKPAKKKSGIDRVPELDGVRGLAALGVLLAHLPEVVYVPALKHPRELLGWFSVDVFFVLSGFLITRILLDDRKNGVPLGFFLMRRFLRILPLYYFVILIALVWNTIAGRPSTDVFWASVYLSNYYFAWSLQPSMLGHTWSLCVEEHFYILWPLVVYGLSRVWSRRVALYGIVPLALVSAWFFIEYTDDRHVWNWVYKTTTCRAASLALGALWAYHELWIRRNSRAALLLAAGLFIFGFAILVGRLKLIDDDWRIMAQLIFFACLSGAVVMTVITTTGSRAILARVLRGKFLCWVGKISYGVYLYHMLVYYAFGLNAETSASRARLLTPLAVACTFAVAWASFAFFERPILKLQDRFRRREPAPFVVQ